MIHDKDVEHSVKDLKHFDPFKSSSGGKLIVVKYTGY